MADLSEDTREARTRVLQAQMAAYLEADMDRAYYDTLVYGTGAYNLTAPVRGLSVEQQDEVARFAHEFGQRMHCIDVDRRDDGSWFNWHWNRGRCDKDHMNRWSRQKSWRRVF